MSYEPTNWQTGDIITSEKLNKLEQGVVNASSCIVHGIWDDSTATLTLDKTWAEICHMALNHVVVVLNDYAEVSEQEPIGYVYAQLVTRVAPFADKYFVDVLSFDAGSSNVAGVTYSCDSPTDYPFIVD